MSEEQQGDVNHSSTGQDPGEQMVTLTQRQLNDKIRFAKQEAEERAARRLSQEQPVQGHKALTKEEIAEIAKQAVLPDIDNVKQHVQQSEEHKEYLRIANTFLTKVEQDKENVPDYDKKVNPSFYEKHAPLVQLAAYVDNPACIMAELKDNVLMRNGIYSCLQNRDFEGAQQLMGELSNRLKKNHDAKQQEKAAKPIAQYQSSKVGLENGKPGSVTDFRKFYSR